MNIKFYNGSAAVHPWLGSSLSFATSGSGISVVLGIWSLVLLPLSSLFSLTVKSVETVNFIVFHPRNPLISRVCTTLHVNKFFFRRILAMKLKP